MIDMKAEVNGLNEKVVKMLAERKMTVSAAESCTGGLFAALITNISVSRAKRWKNTVQ